AGCLRDVPPRARTPAHGPTVCFGFVIGQGDRIGCGQGDRRCSRTKFRKFCHCSQGIIGRLRRVGGYSGKFTVAASSASAPASASLPAIGLIFTFPRFLSAILGVLTGGCRPSQAIGSRRPKILPRPPSSTLPS